MPRLTADDYSSVLRAVQGLAPVSSRDEFVEAMLHEVPSLVRSDVTSINEVDPSADRVVYASAPDTFEFPDGSVAVFVELMHSHPLIAHYAATGRGDALRISDLLERDAWHDTELYRRFYEPIGIEHQMSITMPTPAPIVVGIAVSRAEADFDDRDRAVLDLLRPHAAQSWRRARDHERLARMLGAARSTLSVSGTGVIVLDDPVFELTEGALVSLYRFYGRPGPRDPLPPRVRRWIEAQRQEEAEARTSYARTGRAMLRPPLLHRPLRAALGERELVLRHLPGVRGALDAVLLHERPAGGSSAVSGATMRGIGLSEREWEVLRLLGTGASNAEIAARLSLSIWTIKRHLANVYTKLGVSSRVLAAAVALDIDSHHQREPG